MGYYCSADYATSIIISLTDHLLYCTSYSKAAIYRRLIRGLIITKLRSNLSSLTLVGFLNLTVAIINHQFTRSLFIGSNDKS